MNILLFVLIGTVIQLTSENMIELEEENIEARLSSTGHAFILYHTPWCQPCQTLRSGFGEVAQELAIHRPPIFCGTIDCVLEKNICKWENITSFPTLRYFRLGVFNEEYTGALTNTDILLYLQSKAANVSTQIENFSDVSDFIRGSKDVSILAALNEYDSELEPYYFNLSQEYYLAQYAHWYLHPDFKNETIFLYRPLHLKNKFESHFEIFQGDGADLHNFVNTQYYGLVGHRKKTNRYDFQPPLIVAYFVVDYVKNHKGTNYWRNRILKVAQSHRNIRFAISSIDDFQTELDNIGIDSMEMDLPVVVITDEDDQTYLMEGKFGVERMSNFVTDFEKGLLEPFKKSAPIPKKNDEAVKIVVAKTYDQMVINSGRDTLLEFYAPWCGHCNDFAQKYYELAFMLDNEDLLTVAKMDVTANEVPSIYAVDSIPAFYLIRRNSPHNPIEYKGQRNKHDLLKFVAEHVTSELANYDRDGNEKGNFV